MVRKISLFLALIFLGSLFLISSLQAQTETITVAIYQDENVVFLGVAHETQYAYLEVINKIKGTNVLIWFYKGNKTTFMDYEESGSVKKVGNDIIFYLNDYNVIFHVIPKLSMAKFSIIWKTNCSPFLEAWSFNSFEPIHFIKKGNWSIPVSAISPGSGVFMNLSDAVNSIFNSTLDTSNFYVQFKNASEGYRVDPTVGVLNGYSNTTARLFEHTLEKIKAYYSLYNPPDTEHYAYTYFSITHSGYLIKLESPSAIFPNETDIDIAVFKGELPAYTSLIYNLTKGGIALGNEVILKKPVFLEAGTYTITMRSLSQNFTVNYFGKRYYRYPWVISNALYSWPLDGVTYAVVSTTDWIDFSLLGNYTVSSGYNATYQWKGNISSDYTSSELSLLIPKGFYADLVQINYSELKFVIQSHYNFTLHNITARIRIPSWLLSQAGSIYNIEFYEDGTPLYWYPKNATAGEIYVNLTALVPGNNTLEVILAPDIAKNYENPFKTFPLYLNFSNPEYLSESWALLNRTNGPEFWNLSSSSGVYWTYNASLGAITFYSPVSTSHIEYRFNTTIPVKIPLKLMFNVSFWDISDTRNRLRIALHNETTLITQITNYGGYYHVPSDFGWFSSSTEPFAFYPPGTPTGTTAVNWNAGITSPEGTFVVGYEYANTTALVINYGSVQTTLQTDLSGLKFYWMIQIQSGDPGTATSGKIGIKWLYLAPDLNISYSFENVSHQITQTSFIYSSHNDTYNTINFTLTNATSEISVSVQAHTTNAIYSVDLPSYVPEGQNATATITLKDALGNPLNQSVNVSIYAPESPAIYWDSTMHHLIYFYNGVNATPYGYHFNGVNQYGEVSIPSSVFSQNYTIIYFAKANITPTNRYFLSPPVSMHLSLEANTGKWYVIFWYKLNGTTYGAQWKSGFNMCNSEWWMIGAVLDNLTAEVFRNNELVWSGTLKNHTWLGSNTMVIGASGLERHNLNGTIAYVLIYNRSLNATEISELYNALRNFSETIPITNGLVFALTPYSTLASGKEIWNTTVQINGTGNITLPALGPGKYTVEVNTTGSWPGVLDTPLYVYYVGNLTEFNFTWQPLNSSVIEYTWNLNLPKGLPGYLLYYPQGLNISLGGWFDVGGLLKHDGAIWNNLTVIGTALNSLKNVSVIHSGTTLYVHGFLINPQNQPITNQAIHIVINGIDHQIYPNSLGYFDFTGQINLTTNKIVIWSDPTFGWVGYYETTIQLGIIQFGGGGGIANPPSSEQIITVPKSTPIPKPPQYSLEGFLIIPIIVGGALIIASLSSSTRVKVKGGKTRLKIKRRRLRL